MLPALNRIAQKPSNKGRGVQVLVLTPTRELALQVSEATATYGSNLDDLRIATVVGGMPYGAQLKALSRRVDVLVATPGRLLDHLQARRVDLSTVHTLVLDEADRMLDMGFIDDINTIVDRTPQDRQTLLFSATLDGTVAKLAARMMRDPQRIQVLGGLGIALQFQLLCRLHQLAQRHLGRLDELNQRLIGELRPGRCRNRLISLKFWLLGFERFHQNSNP
jgi:superfamily II DNA/RNA helicase